MDLNEAIHELQRAARTLAPEQGRIARRNARRRTLRALKAARAALDASFPAIRLERKKRRAPLKPIERVAALKAKGYVEASVPTYIARCSAAGIRAVVVNIPTGPTAVTVPKTFLPGWAYEIAARIADDRKLVEAKKSKKVREGLIALLNLERSR